MIVLVANLRAQCLLLACVIGLVTGTNPTPKWATAYDQSQSRLARLEPLSLSESISQSATQSAPNQLLKTPEPSSTSDFDCPTQFGHYRDTSNCAAYYICTFGLSLHKNCSSGLYFSERLQTCDWPTNVPCERDFSLAETSVYNLVDESTSTTSLPVPHNGNPNAARVRDGQQHRASSDLSETVANRPLLPDAFSPYTVDDALANTQPPPPPNDRLLGDREYKSRSPPVPLVSPEKVPLISAEASSKYASAKYVVDGFEVPANNRAEANLYSDTANYSKSSADKSPSEINSSDNSTFLEISNLGSATDQNKNFQKRNDFDPYWPSVGFSQTRGSNTYLSSINQDEPRYFRHRPQSELTLKNLNPYMPQVSHNQKSEPFYVYDSGAETVAPVAPSSPYRSRYQHRYQQARQDIGPDPHVPPTKPESLPPPNEQSIYINSRTELDTTSVVPPLTYSTSKPKPVEVKPIRRKVPEVYIEVISNDNFTAPYSIITGGDDQSLYMVNSRPTKRLNYEINERLLAPFKQREHSSQVNWLDKPTIPEKVAARLSGVNRYSDQLNRQMERASSPSNGQYRKKVVRKKINRPAGMAASSSTNLYGHSSTHLLTGALIAAPVSKQVARPQKAVPPKSATLNQSAFASFISSNDPNNPNIELSGWKPVTSPSFFPPTTTSSPMLLSFEQNLPTSSKLSNAQEFIAPPMTTESPKMMAPTEPTVQIHRKGTSSDLIDAFKANYDSLLAKQSVPAVNGESKSKRPQSTYRVKYTSPKTRKVNLAQQNRYIVIPQKGQSPLHIFKFEYKNSTNVNSEFVATNRTNSQHEFDRNKYAHALAQIAPTESPIFSTVPVKNNSVPIRDSLEDYIKKAIEPKMAINTTTPPRSFTQARAFPASFSRPVINSLESSPVLPTEDATRVANPRRIGGPRAGQGTRKYRPLITLEQSTLSTPSKPTLPGPFSSQRILPTTPSPIDFTTRATPYIQKESIKLEEPNSIFTYHSPKSNEVSEVNVNFTHTYIPHYPSTPQHSRHTDRNVQSATQAPSLMATLPFTTSTVETVDIRTNLIQTQVPTTTTNIPRVTSYKLPTTSKRFKSRMESSSTTTPIPRVSYVSTTTSTTTAAPVPTEMSTDTYGYYEDYDNYGDYEESDYHLMGNKTSVLSDATAPITTTTSTTTTTTASPVVPSYHRTVNTTSKPLIYLTNKPRPTNRRLVIKDSNMNQVVALASRPKPLYPQPKALVTASKCDKRKCRLPDCRCGGSDIPGDLPSKQIPQLVMLTFDDGVNDLNWELYEDLLNSGRKNPNGCKPKATFYVSHEWTDYGQVQTLYARGHEIASHTISHRFGEKFSKEEWIKEINGQREILNLYGGVKFDDIRGMRAPFLQTGGNNMFEMLYETNFTYDSSLPVQENSPPFWPYTLDYSLSHSCNIPPCPKNSFPGLWEVGMVMWSDLRGGRCSMGDACTNPADDAGVYEMLLKNFNRHYKSNRAPFSLYYHSAWFNTQHHKKGFIKFLDEILQNNDVYMVTTWQAIQWVRQPTPLSKLDSFEPFQCKKPKPVDECIRPKVCNVNSKNGGSRTMRTCQECPITYPWIGSTGFSKAKYG